MDAVWEIPNELPSDEPPPPRCEIARIYLARYSQFKLLRKISSHSYLFVKSDITSALVFASVLIAPLNAEVIVLAPAALAPRIVIHKCSASITTATPKGSKLSYKKSAISVVNLS